MDILQQCEIMEILGYHDASVGWVAMICSDSGHYAARVEESVARELYPDMDLLTAGWLAPIGQAHRAKFEAARRQGLAALADEHRFAMEDMTEIRNLVIRRRS